MSSVVRQAIYCSGTGITDPAWAVATAIGLQPFIDPSNLCDYRDGRLSRRTEMAAWDYDGDLWNDA